MYQNFACGAYHIICMQCFIWEVGSATASVQACVPFSVRYARARIEFFASPEGTILLGILATSGSFGRGAQRGQHSKAWCATAALATAALTVAALAAICSGFRLLGCHCTVRCWGSVHGPCPALKCVRLCYVGGCYVSVHTVLYTVV